MADEIISISQNSNLTITRIARKFRDERDPTGAENITGWTLKFMVKRHIDDSDAAAIVDLTASIVTAASGVHSVTLTPAHSSLSPGIYPGEWRWWTAAPAAGDPPTDRRSVDYIVNSSVGPVAP